MRFVIFLFTLLTMSVHAEPSKSKGRACLSYARLGGAIVQMREDGVSTMRARRTVENADYGDSIWMRPYLLNIAEDVYDPTNPIYRFSPAKAEKIFYESCMEAEASNTAR